MDDVPLGVSADVVDGFVFPDVSAQHTWAASLCRLDSGTAYNNVFSHSVQCIAAMALGPDASVAFILSFRDAGRRGWLAHRRDALQITLDGLQSRESILECLLHLDPGLQVRTEGSTRRSAPVVKSAL